MAELITPVPEAFEVEDVCKAHYPDWKLMAPAERYDRRALVAAVWRTALGVSASGVRSDTTENAPWCSCKGVVTEVGKCDGACAAIPGWEDRARFRSDTTSQGDR
jgi:hypothetical protein